MDGKEYKEAAAQMVEFITSYFENIRERWDTNINMQRPNSALMFSKQKSFSEIITLLTVVDNESRFWWKGKHSIVNSGLAKTRVLLKKPTHVFFLGFIGLFGFY